MSDEALRLLRSIDASLKHLLAVSGPTQPVSSLAVAPAHDLDGKYGNPPVRFMPKRWQGADYKGRKMSDCPADLLDLYAETFDYLAGKAEEEREMYNGKPTAPFKRRDAARARGWAQRIRARGGSPPSGSRSGAAQNTPEWNDATGSDADWLGDSFS